MKNMFFAVAFCGLLSMTGVHAAHAAGAVVNAPCAQKGATTMADDEKSILACLYNENKTALNWKTMTESGTSGSMCGLAHGIIKGSPMTGACNRLQALTTTFPCGSSTPFLSISTSGHVQSFVSRCPAGYGLYVSIDSMATCKSQGDDSDGAYSASCLYGYTGGTPTVSWH